MIMQLFIFLKLIKPENPIIFMILNTYMHFHAWFGKLHACMLSRLYTIIIIGRSANIYIHLKCVNPLKMYSSSRLSMKPIIA